MKISRKTSDGPFRRRNVAAVIAFAFSAFVTLSMIVLIVARGDYSSPFRSTFLLAHSKESPIRDTLLHYPGISAEFVWNQLVEEGAHQLKMGQVGVAIEVGMHKATQCLQAAIAGLQAHCVEPSPVSFQRVQTKVLAAEPTVQSRVHLYPAAAGPQSNDKVKFSGSGGTGDHVGDVDMWNMKAGKPTDRELAKKQGELIEITTISLDDIINNKLENGEDRAFLVKVDTQGFEPAVLSGLSKSLTSHKVQFLLMEYWPHGMDLIMDKPAGTCVAAELVTQLRDAGYSIYALPASSHPAAPADAKRAMHRDTMPLHDVTAHCQWFYDLEKRHPSNAYKMGYWADILAVAPGIKLPSSPISRLVKDLFSRTNYVRCALDLPHILLFIGQAVPMTD